MYLMALKYTLSLGSTTELIGSNITNITMNVTSTNNNLIISNSIIVTQLISLGISTLSISIGLSTASTAVDLNEEQRIRYSWTYGFTPSRKKHLIKHLVTKITLIGWNWMHLIICIIGISTFFTFAPLSLPSWIVISIMILFFIVYNIIRWKFGCWHIYKTLGINEDSSKIKQFLMYGLLTPILNLLLFMTNFMGPVPLLRNEQLNGAFGFIFGLISTLLFSLINIFSFDINPLFKTVTWICIPIYILCTSIFFMVIEKKYIRSFFWSDNFKTSLRNKWWNYAMHSSKKWKEPSLIGNLDAHRAWIVQKYHLSDLGFINVVNWIKKNKNEWENNPPLWYTDHWKENLRKRIIKECYKDVYEKIMSRKSKMFQTKLENG